MSIGAGIAIAVIWVFPTVCAMSDRITGDGLMVASVLAFATTAIIMINE